MRFNWGRASVMSTRIFFNYELGVLRELYELLIVFRSRMNQLKYKNCCYVTYEYPQNIVKALTGSFSSQQLLVF